MKRSEMLKDINILIEDGLKNQHSVETISRSVLEYQESQGMTPPTYEEDCCPEELKGTELEGCYTAFIPEWENEDE